MIRKPSAPQKGFTLIEIALAISILAIVITFAYSMVVFAVETSAVSEEKVLTQRTAKVLLDRLQREFQTINNRGMTLQNAPTRCKEDRPIYVCGKVDSVQGKQFSLLSFVANNGSQYLPNSTRKTGQVEITYVVQEDTTPGEDSPLTLFRNEIPEGIPTEEVSSERLGFPILRDIKSFRLRFYNATERAWYDTWGRREGQFRVDEDALESIDVDDEDEALGDSFRQRVPDLIELTIGIPSNRGDGTTYTTILATNSRQ